MSARVDGSGAAGRAASRHSPARARLLGHRDDMPPIPAAARPAAKVCRPPQGRGRRAAAHRCVAAASAPSSSSFSPATIVSNAACSADGRMRLLLLSVADEVGVLSDARRAASRSKRAGARWVDRFEVPGQQVEVRAGGDDGSGSSSSPASLHPLACSPYGARVDSAALDACLVELLVDRGSPKHAALGSLGPGALVGVGPVTGSGFCPLFERAHADLPAALEAGRPLLFIGSGAAGTAAVRSALAWAPVQAAAAAGRVSAILVAPDAASAPCLVEWDDWREAGVRVVPAYTGGGGEDGAPTATASPFAIEGALFAALNGDGDAPAPSPGLARLLAGRPGDGAVLVAGVPGRVAAALARRLADGGLGADRVMFPDPMF